MKSKKFSKSLSLNKRTIASLSDSNMDVLKGKGIITDDDYTCYYISCLCPTSPYLCCTGPTGDPCPCKTI